MKAVVSLGHTERRKVVIPDIIESPNDSSHSPCMVFGRAAATTRMRKRPGTIDLRQRITSDESGAAEFQIAPRLLRGIMADVGEWRRLAALSPYQAFRFADRLAAAYSTALSCQFRVVQGSVYPRS